MGNVRVITRFDDFADPDMPYMYHCHLLMHEDEGMMGQFLVVDPDGIAERGVGGTTSVWPNPVTSQTCNVHWPESIGIVHMSLIDATGRTVHSTTVNGLTHGQLISLPDLAQGSYTLRLRDTSGQQGHATMTILH